ncbi:unnamed protein product [Cuscuta epithymum]|uniref:Uncharacterized protein n=1 Tax=Cuscuta epithymum TaxID=186058 RepID=A0AAV0EXZ2_9ASTE|nr:unnamed protein product [Cuscuta epithymum]CAH9128076.1 unnamed protein product [Cuscuta epithymum]
MLIFVNLRITEVSPNLRPTCDQTHQTRKKIEKEKECKEREREERQLALYIGRSRRLCSSRSLRCCVRAGGLRVASRHMCMAASEVRTNCEDPRWKLAICDNLRREDAATFSTTLNSLEEEVKELNFSMHPEKGPGLDGMTLGFIHHSWDVVG